MQLCRMRPAPPLGNIFEPIYWKIRRANSHGTKADELFMSEPGFHEAILEPDGNGGFVYRVISVAEFPITFSIFIGEAAHQLRSCLDYLLFMFCNPTTDREERSVQFPLVDAPEFFDETKGRMPGIRGGIGGP